MYAYAPLLCVCVRAGDAALAAARGGRKRLTSNTAAAAKDAKDG